MFLPDGLKRKEVLRVNVNNEHTVLLLYSQTLIYRAPIYREPAPIYRGHFLSPYTVQLQVFSVKQNPDLPGSPINRGNFLSPTIPVNRGLTVVK